MAPNIALTTSVSLRSSGHHLHSHKDRVLLARNDVDHERVVARLQLVKDATSRCTMSVVRLSSAIPFDRSCTTLGQTTVSRRQTSAFQEPVLGDPEGHGCWEAA